MKRLLMIAILGVLGLAVEAGAQAILIGNETIGLHVTASGSPIGGALEYPSGTSQGYLEAYWVRYGGQAFRSEWPFDTPGAVRVTETEPMRYTSNGPNGIEAVGRAVAGQIEITTVATALPGHNWLRLVYTLTNIGDQPVENPRFFQFADVDVGPAGVGGAEPENADDTARFVASVNAVYTADNVADPAAEPPGLAIGIMSPLPPDHHDVYGGPNPDFPEAFANPAYYDLENDALDDSRTNFTGDAGMTMEWDVGTLLPGQSVSIPVYFFGVLEENDVPDIFDEVGIIGVSIDVKPGSNDNPVNLGSRGVLPVALLAEEEFDAEEVDPRTILLGDPQLTGRAAPERWSLEDVNGDRLMDLMMHFDLSAMISAGAINGSTPSLELTARTRNNVLLRGQDKVRIVPPDKPSPKPKGR